LNNKISGLRIDENRLKYYGTEDVKLSVEIRDKDDKVTGKHWKEFV